MNRQAALEEMKRYLAEFEKNKHDMMHRRGLFVFGSPGVGKTTFVIESLRELQYDVVVYDAGDVRKTSVIEEITKYSLGDNNVLNLFFKKKRRIAIVMDEIDGMNIGDKGGIVSLMKLLRPKKTKKQQTEETAMVPVVCIGTYKVDTKIKDLMKVCTLLEIPRPSAAEICALVSEIVPQVPQSTRDHLVEYVGHDLRKLAQVRSVFASHPEIFAAERRVRNLFQVKQCSHESRAVVKRLLTEPHRVSRIPQIMNDADRTMVGLLWHENVVDKYIGRPAGESVPAYLAQLACACWADAMDRVMFQNQVWQLGEVTMWVRVAQAHALLFGQQARAESLSKTFPILAPIPAAPSAKKKSKVQERKEQWLQDVKKEGNDLRFTSALSRFRVQRGNQQFIQDMTQRLQVDHRDLFAFFHGIRQQHLLPSGKPVPEIFDKMEEWNVPRSKVERVLKFMEKYINEHAVIDLCDVTEIQEEAVEEILDEDVL